MTKRQSSCTTTHSRKAISGPASGGTRTIGLDLEGVRTWMPLLSDSKANTFDRCVWTEKL
jgi:hypothetical protein